MKMKALSSLATSGILLLGLGSAGCETTSGNVEPKFSSLYENYFKNCKQCHAPGAAGATSTTEKSLDFSNASSAYATLAQGKATGLTGNQAGCNGVSFIAKGDPAHSLALAVLDESTRSAFDLAGNPGCDTSAISDMAFKVNQVPSAAVLSAFKSWISAGAAND